MLQLQNCSIKKRISDKLKRSAVLGTTSNKSFRFPYGGQNANNSETFEDSPPKALTLNNPLQGISKIAEEMGGTENVPTRSKNTVIFGGGSLKPSVMSTIEKADPADEPEEKELPEEKSPAAKDEAEYGDDFEA